MARDSSRSSAAQDRPVEEPSARNEAVPAGLTEPLSFSQNRLWFLHQLDPRSSVYNRPVLLRLTGTLQLDALTRALNEIVRRHAVLRASFPSEDGRPRQVVAPKLPVDVPVLDMSDGPHGERMSKARSIAVREAERPFNLERGPVARALLLRIDDSEHLLLTTFHHIVFDGWSSQLFLRELGILYEAFAAGEGSPLPDLAWQYADFARWQQEVVPDQHEGQLAYWRERLTGVPALHLSENVRSHAAVKAGRQRFRIPRAHADELRALARSEQGTLFMVLLAAFKLVLLRYSGQDDFAVGCPVAGRRRTDVEGLIGCFVNSLALRTDLSGRPAFRTLLSRVRETTLGALAHQDVPFERIVEELQPVRSLVHAPLFQVFFQLRNYPRHTRKTYGLTFDEETIDLGAAGLDLTLELTENEDGLSGCFIFNEELFGPKDAIHLVEQYVNLLHQILENADRPIDEYTLVTRRARAVLPDPAAPLPAAHHDTVPDLFRTWASRTPDAVAVRHGERAWSFGMLEARVDRLTRTLAAAGLRRGETVAVVGPRSFGVVAAMLGVLSAGGVILPIGMDVPVERRRVMLREGGAKMVLRVGDERSAERLEGLPTLHLDAVAGELLQAPGRLESLPAHGPDASAGEPRQNGEAAAPADLAPIDSNDPAYVFFTSGTTGHPKGILGDHKGLSHFLAWQRETFAVAPSDRCSHLTALSFDPVLREIFLPLTSGAVLCIPRKELGPDDVLRWLAEEEITIAHTVPSMARAWLTGAEVPSLRITFFAGEPLPDTLVREWRRAAAGDVVNLYGPTETTMVKCFYRVPEEVPAGIQPVGRPLPQSQALVLGPGDRLCGVNERGEVVLRTPFRTRGYLKRPDENRARFVPNPFRDDPDDLVYRTGDAGYYRADGQLVVTGRIDNQIKINGVRIEPEEISVLLARHPDVAAAVVDGRKDPEPALAAYVVARSQGVTARTLRAYLADHLQPAMIPGAFVFLDALPLTRHGKIDRSRLPEATFYEAARSDAAPRTPEEAALSRISAEVLGRDTVGLDDDLFDLGAHSLLIMRIIAQIREEFDVDVPVRRFFELPTVSQLAEAVASARAEPDLQDLLDALHDIPDEQIERYLRS